MFTATVIENRCPESATEFPFAVQHNGKDFVLREAQVFARCAMFGVPKVKAGAEVLVIIDEGSGSAWLTEPHVNLGHTGYRHPQYPGYLFSAEQGIQNHSASYATSDGEPYDPRKAYFEDTRPTIGEVLEQIGEFENKHLKIAKKNWRSCCGPWDEYVSCRDHAGMNWPDAYQWVAVYVVTGGSEGLYLHVDVLKDGKRINVILGKTLDSGREKWFECYASAARIARYLGA